MQVLDLFLEGLVAEKGASKNTVAAYRRDISDFFTICKKPFETVQQNDIRLYLRSLHEKELSPRTIARRLSALRHFYAFLFEQSEVRDNPTADVSMPKLGKTLPKVMTQADVQALLEACCDRDGPEGVRLVCLLELLYATGLRVSELLSLPYSDVLAALKTDQVPAPLIVTGKGKKERLIFLSKGAIESLKAYFDVRGAFISDAQSARYLFPSGSAQGYLTRQRFGQLLKEIALEAGLAPEKVSPHVLRHAFASHMLGNGADLLSLQKLLGHSDISTTEIYTHVMHEKLEETVLECHPLSNTEKKTKT